MRPGGRQKYDAATAAGPPLRAGRLLTFFVRPPAAPRTQKETLQETVDHALSAPHPCAATRVHRTMLAQPHDVIHSFIHSFHSIPFHSIPFHFISFHFISFHFISFHFNSFQFISIHFNSFQFISFNSFNSFNSFMSFVQ